MSQSDPSRLFTVNGQVAVITGAGSGKLDIVPPSFQDANKSLQAQERQ